MLDSSSPPLPERYEFLDTIGRGGHSAVYKARDRVIGRIVAIKTVGGQDDRIKALLMREGRLLRSLSHPGIVAIHEVAIVGDQVFIIQEFVDGRPLGEWQQAAPVDALIDVYEQVARALAFMHERRVVHRDLKPGNVLVRERNRAVILDFGLAVHTFERDSLTSTGATVVGTPGYMAPESISGVETEAPADVFALGVMLAEAVSRRRLWTYRSVTDLLMQGLSESPSETLARVPEVTAAGLERLVAAMLAKAPGERPSAAAVAEALAAARSKGVDESAPTLVAAAPPTPPPIATAVAFPAPAAAPALSIVTPGVVAAWVAGACALIVTVTLLVWKVGAATVGFTVLLLAGCGLVVAAAARRRAKVRDDLASMQTVAHRISAIEAQVTQADEMTRSLAVAIEHLGQQMSAERLQDVIRQSVVIAIQELKPAANAGTESQRALEMLLAERGRTSAASGLKERVKEYGGMVAGGVTMAGAVVGLLGTTDMWRPNHPPTIVSFGSDDERLRRSQPFALMVDARDEDGDELTFEWRASAGRIEERGAAATWLPPAELRDRLVSLTLTVSDGTRAASRTRTIRVNDPPRGEVAVEGRLRPGGIVRLAVQGTDPDGDPLKIVWVVSGGTLAQASGPMVLWTLPAQPGEVQAICQVSDGYETVSLVRALRIGS